MNSIKLATFSETNETKLFFLKAHPTDHEYHNAVTAYARKNRSVVVNEISERPKSAQNIYVGSGFFSENTSIAEINHLEKIKRIRKTNFKQIYSYLWKSKK